MSYEYNAQAFADFNAVRAGRKPLMIVTSEKSDLAYETIVALAWDQGLQCKEVLLRGEDGNLHDHVLVSLRGTPYVHEALRYIDMCRFVGSLSRRELQLRLGLLLGHAAAECADFSDSHVGRTCKCDCCGGPATAEKPTDGNPSRFTPNAYAY